MNWKREPVIIGLVVLLLSIPLAGGCSQITGARAQNQPNSPAGRRWVPPQEPEGELTVQLRLSNVYTGRL
ncbi:MAG: hypothetical protein Q8L35_08225 [Actinomycetota bacterium]|nr:hypothetical protein [Actinomycetota bacterium]